MKIVVLDRPLEMPGELDWSALDDLGSVVCYDRTPPEKVLERIGDAEIVLLNKAELRADTIRRCPALRFISVIGTGYNTVDVDAAAARGIPVSNVPAYGTEAIGQHAIALLLEITNHVAHHDGEVRKLRRSGPGDWCFWDYPMIELYGKTAGVIGLGRIGQQTARILGAMGMKVLANDKFESDAGRAVAEYTDRETLFRESDVIFLHCPLFPDTEGLINKDTIAKMKDGVILINNSRGQLVVEQDLADALNSGKVYAAGLDVVSTEPIREDNPLLKAKNCVITPHISWAAKAARQRIMDTTVENVRSFLNGNPMNVVNKV